MIYATADYDLLELRCLGQVCLSLLGESALAAALNSGTDVHLSVAAQLLGISYKQAFAQKSEPEVAEARQLAKVLNFGLPGGLGAKMFALFARKATGGRVQISEARAKELKETWLATWPEMRAYFRLISDACGPDGATVRHLFSNRIRAGAKYTEACNSYFQGLGADATGHALFLISKACYVRGAEGENATESPLFGCRVVNYVHDEFILEVPEERGAAAANELMRLMIKGANVFLPDVPATAEPKLMRFWSKDAKAIRNPEGVLVPWPN